MFEVDGIKYSIKNNNEVEIIGNSIFEPTELCIKNIVEYAGNKFHVISISNDAFKDCSHLLSVQIENGINNIGENAFRNCNYLTIIKIPSSVSIVGAYALAGCSRLNELIFEDSKTHLHIIPENETCKIGSFDITLNFSGENGGWIFNWEKDIRINIYSRSYFSNLPIKRLYLGRNLHQTSTPHYTIEMRGGGSYAPDIYCDIISYDALFHNLTKLEELTIAENVNIVGSNKGYISEDVFTNLLSQNCVSNFELCVTPGSFKNCSSIQTVDVKSSTPPTGAEFSTTVYNNAKLYVPDNTYSKYSSADGWKEFVNMIIAPNAIVLDKETITMNVGDICKISADVYPENTTDKTITWVSSDDSVVRVSYSGEVTGVSEGKATITASCGNVSASCEVEVLQDTGIEDILVNPNEELQIYDLQGILVLDSVKPKDLKQLSSGYYIVVSQSKKWKIKI